MDLIALQNAIKDQFIPGLTSIHGPSHWLRVEAFGLKLAEGTDADIDVIRLFALFHDACRLHDGGDREHGPRGANWPQNGEENTSRYPTRPLTN